METSFHGESSTLLQQHRQEPPRNRIPKVGENGSYLRAHENDRRRTEKALDDSSNLERHAMHALKNQELKFLACSNGNATSCMPGLGDSEDEFGILRNDDSVLAGGPRHQSRRGDMQGMDFVVVVVQDGRRSFRVLPWSEQ